MDLVWMTEPAIYRSDLSL